MSTSRSIRLAIVVWFAALAAAAALVVVVRAPARESPLELAMDPRRPTVAAEATIAWLDDEPIVIPTMRISAAASRGRPPPPAPSARCGAWRPLVQGDLAQRVRACEGAP